MILKLNDVLNLYFELNGVTNGQNVVSEGILKQKTSLKTKVYLQRLNKALIEDVKFYEESRKDLFMKYGQESEGTYSIPPENVTNFNKEMSELISAERNVDVSAFWGSDLTLDSLQEIETNEFYPILFSLLDK